MWEDDYRPLLFTIILGMMAVVAVATAAHFVVRRAVRDIISQSTARQLQLDAISFKTGAPLRQLCASPTTTNRNLLSVISTRI